MNISLEKQFKEFSKLEKKHLYHKIIEQLTDDYLKSVNDYRFFFTKANALISIGDFNEAKVLLNRALEDYPNCIQFHLQLAHINVIQKDFSKATNIYTHILEIDNNNVSAYLGLADCYIENKDHENALKAYKKAIEINDRYYYSYYARAFLYLQRKEYNKALSDINVAIRMYPFSSGFVLRSEIWIKKEEPQRAIKDLDKAINLDRNCQQAYYLRAIIHSMSGKHVQALADFAQFVKLMPERDNYQSKNAQTEIERLTKKLANKWYDEIDEIVQEIKNKLLFEKDCLTHYTSMTGAKEMILNNSPFRISEGAFLNDTSEGRELFNYLSYSVNKSISDDTIAEKFAERPFIGSFVADSKHNDLALWRMYGKERDAEAKGCALTIKRKEFLANVYEQFSKTSAEPFPIVQQDVVEILKDKLENNRSLSKMFIVDEEVYKLLAIDLNHNIKFTFYNVAYYQKDSFFIPGSDVKTGDNLNKLLAELKNRIEVLSDIQRSKIAALLNDIAYLFKSAAYQYENEVRLVVQDIGMPKTIDQSYTPPRVHVQLLDIRPVLHRITLGPKVERADEWAAAFNYHIKEHSEYKKSKVEIIISHLPFK